MLHRVYRLWVTKPDIDVRILGEQKDIAEWLARVPEFGPAAMIELAGRVCYRSFHNPSGRTTAQYVDNLIQQRHFSVLEHVSVGYLICTSREVTHELVRHRHLSYSQESTRYVEPDPAAVNIPSYALEDAAEAVEAWLRATRTAYEAVVRAADRHYGELSGAAKRKAVRQDARRILPTALATRIVVTGNLRAWWEAIEKRVDEAADWAIRTVFLSVLDDLEVVVPEVFAGRWERYEAPDGFPAARRVGRSDCV